MAPILMVTEPGSKSAYLQASQNLASGAGSTAETIRASSIGAIFNHAGFRRSGTHRECMLGLTRNSENMILASGPCIALHEEPREFKLWQ